MSVLQGILSSKSRAEIFRLLFSEKPNELHVREIQRRSCLNDSTVRQELLKLKKFDLIKSRKDGNRLYYSANREHPLYQDIRNLVLKTAGLAGILKAALADRRIRVAFVFGSLGKGEEKAGSDVDLIIIGSLGLNAVVQLLAGVTNRIEREINPHVLDEAEFRERFKNNDHFIANVMRSPKIFIVGNEHDLEAMGG